MHPELAQFNSQKSIFMRLQIASKMGVELEFLVIEQLPSILPGIQSRQGLNDTKD
jgi:hypothetical protein